MNCREFVDFLMAYLENELGSLETIHLIGSSMGGLAALWYSAQHPGRIGRNRARVRRPVRILRVRDL